MSSGEIVISGGTGGNSLKKTPVNSKSRNKKKTSRPNSKTASSNNEKVVPPRKKHYADMKRLNRLYKSHDAAMRKRDMAFRKRQEELNKQNTSECTFQPIINRNRRIKAKNTPSIHIETILHQWSAITEEEVKLLEEFNNDKKMVPLNVDSGDKVKVVEKRVGKSKYWCRILFRDIEGIVPMRCLSQYSGFDRLYKEGLEDQKEKDKLHKKRMEKPKGMEECTFQPDLITRKDANGRYWLSKVGASASPPKKVLASGLLAHNNISPNTKRLPLAQATSIHRRIPNPPMYNENSNNIEFNRTKRNNNNNAVRRKRMSQMRKKYDPMESIKNQRSSYLNRKLSPTSKFKYGIDRSIEMPYWDERATALQNANDNVDNFSNTIERIFTKTNNNRFNNNFNNSVERNHFDQSQTVDELKRIEMLNGLETELLRTEFVTATDQITDELKSLRFQLNQQHEELLSKTPAAIQQNLKDNPHLVRAARSNLKLLKNKRSPNTSPLRTSPNRNQFAGSSPTKRSVTSPNRNILHGSPKIIRYSVGEGSPVYVNNNNNSDDNNNNNDNLDSTSPFSAGKRHFRKVKKYRKGVLKSLNKRIGGFT